MRIALIIGASCIGLAGCVTEPPTVEEAMVSCVERALDARGPKAGATIGVNSNTGPSAGFSIGFSSDFLAGRTPEETFDLCVRNKTGLPPTPIGAPTLESLVSAMRPKKSPYLYYLHDANKVLHPSRNAAEHEALRKKYNVY